MNEAWAVVAAALGSAFLTIAGTFWLEQWRLGRAGKAAHNDRLREACVQMGAHALSLVLRAQALYLTAIFRSGIGEGLDIVLHHRKPIDPMELADWLAVDLKPMLEAQSLIELTAGEELVRAAAGLVLAAMAVLERAGRATSSPAGPDASVWHRFVSRFKALVPLHRDPEVEKAIQETVRELGRQLRKFTRVTRERLGVNDPDAVIRAFPELFADPVVSDEGPDASQALV
ncbi:MAG: hypothetical protein ACYDEY_09415 [Acidimicrobiales bacterium]